MANNIVLSAGVRQNLLALQNTADLMGRTQQRLATGKKVNSALDNPINFFTAAGLNNRAGDLGSLLDSVSNAIKTLEAADNGIKSIKALVETAQATALQALQNPATTAKYTGTVANLSATSSFAFTAGKTITVNDGTTTGTLTLAATNTVQDFIDMVNNTASLNVKAELSSDGKILLEATGANTIVIGGTAVAGEMVQFGLVAGTTAAGTVNSTRTTLASQYDALRTQLDQLARDAGFNGVNLLNGDGLKVIFNETSTSSLAISGVTFTSTGLGVSASTNSFQTDKDIADAVAELSTALTTLRTQASTFGSNLSIVQTRQDFTKTMINTLMTGADNLTLADSNEEGANLLALQTRQQLSTTTLSLAASAQQNVLRLFG